MLASCTRDLPASRRSSPPSSLRRALPALALSPVAARCARSRLNPKLTAQDVIPFDAAVRTATLPNGMKVFIRHNGQPAKRVALRLAIKAGSIHEADDQQGLAHLVEHMAFNGSAHFKPGELISAFESIGARLGPHVNAYTSFDETVYMLELPSDKPEIVTKGLTAMADFAGGLTLDAAEIDKERGVVVEEWRGGLGAGSRIRDKQLPGAVLSIAVRGAAADRQARRHPQRARRTAARVLRHLVPARSDGDHRGRRYRSAADRAGHPARCSSRWRRARLPRPNPIGRCRCIKSFSSASPPIRN